MPHPLLVRALLTWSVHSFAEAGPRDVESRPYFSLPVSNR